MQAISGILTPENVDAPAVLGDSEMNHRQRQRCCEFPGSDLSVSAHGSRADVRKKLFVIMPAENKQAILDHDRTVASHRFRQISGFFPVIHFAVFSDPGFINGRNVRRSLAAAADDHTFVCHGGMVSQRMRK